MVRSALTIASLILALAGAAPAEYRRAEYPQTPPAVQAVSVKAPASARTGAAMTVDITVTAVSQMPEDRLLFAYLTHAGAVRHVEVLTNPSPWKTGKNRIKGARIRIPPDIPTGEYELTVGVYQEKAEGRAGVRVTGKQALRLAKIITTGTMVDKHGVPHRWHINHAHTLIWNGRPYLPAGGMFIYDRDWDLVKAQIDLLHRYGVRSIYLHLGVNQPYPWKTYSDDDYRFFQQTIDYLDELGFTYGIEFQALEAKGPGWYYPGRGPRVEVTGPGTVRVEEEKVRDGYFAVFDMDTWEVVQTGRARVSGERHVEADVSVERPGRYQVVFTLERDAPGMFSMYYWDDQYPNYVETVLRHYSKVALGPGFRFIVDPLWNEMNVNRDFFPRSPVYERQLAEWLKQRYGSVEELNRRWRTGEGPLESFEQAARLAPLDRKRLRLRGPEYQFMLDPVTGKVFRMDLSVSQVNYDLQEHLGRSLLHFTCDIADRFKKLYDVPVIYKGFSDLDFWHINDLGTPGGHDGLGMESYGNGEPLLMFMAGHLYGALEQATKTTWLIVTETGEGNHQDNSPSRNKMPGYSSRLGHMYANFNALISGGAKGVFQYNMVPGGGTDQPWTDALTADPRQLEWLATYQRILDNAPALVDYRPPMYFRFPGLYNPNSMNLYSEPSADYAGIGGWWWREPIERSENDIWIVPSFSLRPDAPMFIVNLEDMPATERHRDELVRALNDGVRITMIGFRRDLGSIPEIDRYYTGRMSVDSDGRRFQVLRPTPTSRILGQTAKGEVWNLVDGNLQINSKQVFAVHGYRPDGLLPGKEKPVEPYYGVFRELLGVDLLPADPGMYAFQYSEDGRPVTVIGTLGEARTISFEIPADLRVEAVWPDGSRAGEMRDGRLVVRLEPQKMELVRRDDWPRRDEKGWVRSGLLVDSLDARDSVIIRGLPFDRAYPMEMAGYAIRQAQEALASLPEEAKPGLQRIIERALEASRQGRRREAAEIALRETDAFFERVTPYIWIEAEDRKASNFNYSRIGGIPRLSGGAFLGLETAVEPPADTGWFAEYEFTAPADGVYQLWVRENYLSYSSPCWYRVDGGEWVHVSNQLVPRDGRVVALYNAIEDTRQVFAWYHYGEVRLKKGRHTLTFRVTEKRGKGTSVTMADNRPYAKLMDCILLTAGGFEPSGADRPRRLLPNLLPPLVNLAPSPSFEFRPREGMKEPPGWLRSEDSDDVLWQDAGWGTYNVMPGVAFDVGQRFAYIGQRNLTVRVGEEPRWWRSDIIPVKELTPYLFEVYVRTVGMESASPVVHIIWLAENGDVIGESDPLSIEPNQDWRRHTYRRLISPPGASQAQIHLGVTRGKGGVAYFDDVVFAELPPLSR
jgi:hypothetical protein